MGPSNQEQSGLPGAPYPLGVAYYPEHWPEERWLEDARLMQAAGLNVVRLGEFAWSRLEPEAGRYEFDWLERAINILTGRGLKVILGTPTATPPAWMVAARPDILPVSVEGRPYSFGGRRHYCTTSEYYRAAAISITRALATRFATHPAIVGWQIDNEIGNHGTTRCYCNRCRRYFAGWLRQRYHSLPALNAAWGTVFWSQEYSDWEQIPVPLAAPAGHNPSLLLDFRRFSSAMAVEFMELQGEVIRESFPAARGFITHNLFPQDENINFYELARSLDFIAWDNYPHGTTGPEQVAFHHDMFWGLKRRPGWVMEQQLGPINWTAYNPPVPPGQASLWTAHNQAKGAGGTVYFRWRESRYGQEQYHSAFLGHDARPTRAYHELQETHRQMLALPSDYRQRGQAGVALLFSFEDWWALQIEPNNAAFDYSQLVREVYSSLWQRHVPCDVLPRGTALEVLQEYRLVIVPSALLIDQSENEVWQEYVRGGGKLVLTSRSGVKSRSTVWTDQAQPGGMSEFAGVRVNEWLSFPPAGAGKVAPGAAPAPWGGREWSPQPVALELAGGRATTARRLWLEVLAVAPEVTVLARYGRSDPDDYFAGSPALTMRPHQGGAVYYLACWPENSFYDYLWQELFSAEAVPVAPGLPGGVGLEAIASGPQNRYLTLFNHSHQPVSLPALAGYQTLGETGRPVPGQVPPRGIARLVRA